MRAIQITEPGGPAALTAAEVDETPPEPGHAAVRVAAAGVNFIDTYHRAGRYPLGLPAVIGLEGAGIVEEVGEDVADLATGDRVAWAACLGSYAERLVAPADKLVRVPDGLDLQAAAAVLLQGMTAHYLASSTVPLTPDHSVLVHAGAGGTGQLLVQWAKRRGARVIATTSTADKAAVVRRLGADQVIRYDEVDFAAELHRLGERVDVVYDGVGQATFRRGLDVLRPRGTMVLFGQASGAVEPLDPQLLNARGSLFLTRPSLFHYTATREELRSRADEVLTAVADGSLEVTVDRTWPLAEAAAAHRYLEGRRTRGKLLLIP